MSNSPSECLTARQNNPLAEGAVLKPFRPSTGTPLFGEGALLEPFLLQQGPPYLLGYKLFFCTMVTMVPWYRVKEKFLGLADLGV